MSEERKEPTPDDWVERCKRSDREQASKRALQRGVPEVKEKKQ